MFPIIVPAAHYAAPCGLNVGLWAHPRLYRAAPRLAVGDAL